MYTGDRNSTKADHLLHTLSRLGEFEREVYEAAASRISVTIEELADRTDRPTAEVKDAANILQQLGLLRWTEGRRGAVSVISPDSAFDHMTWPVKQAMAHLQQAVESARNTMSELSALYDSGLASRRRGEHIEIVTDLATVRQRLNEFSELAEQEVITSQPGGARPEQILREAMARTQNILGRGVRIRTLYQHTALFSQSTVAYVEKVAPLGAEVRTLGDGFMRLIAFDRAVAVMAVRDEPQGAVIVRDPSVVDFAVAAFEQAWVRATPFPTSHGREQAIAASEQVKQDIMYLLVDGADDKAIARRMGMSVRTAQRHIAAIMDRLGARNRVQAGFRIREMGLLSGRSADESPDRPTDDRRPASVVRRSRESRESREDGLQKTTARSDRA